ncbi:ras-related protein rab-32 [Anaeramoeba ignava]|uniref:Ras-related protein Rab n=1 Tax=Anaeramoeba ignava TaxID=1746090 RepID=A0A9Q0RAX8_ANAIG|nr:ras-related protein rab-32 [Anaeramoeba ignava]
MADDFQGEDDKGYLYKVLVVGDSGTGKTSYINSFVHGIFSNRYKATIGVDFALKVMNISDDKVVRLQLWDIAAKMKLKFIYKIKIKLGQERYTNMTRVYYNEAVGAFVVFDVTRMDTLENVKKWKNDIDSKTFLPDGSVIPVVLLANKFDLTPEGFGKTDKEMDEFCKEFGFLGWFPTSAKTKLNINECAQFLVNKILENDLKMKQNKKPKEQAIHLEEPLTTQSKGGNGCC